MQIKMDVPKDRVDEALHAEISALKKENARLRKQLEANTRKLTEIEQKGKEVASMYLEMKALCEKYAPHDSCAGL